jgi:NAD(P)-dependent dehydrogenase (short-subunit alcohol dehydrogenase family)
MEALVHSPFETGKKVAVVTGSSAGIGFAIVQRYLKEGYSVFSVARRNIDSLSKDHIHLIADLSQWSENIRIADLIQSKVNVVNTLVNNVGKSEWKSLENISQEFLEKMFTLNVNSYFAMSKGLIRSLSVGSAIINISSMAGKRGSANNSVYSATKFAVNGFTQSLAKELGPRGIRVNALCPVLVESEGLSLALEQLEAPAEKVGAEFFLQQFTASQSALNRLPSAEDVANFCVFLSSDYAGSITGQCINVDCGVFPQ